MLKLKKIAVTGGLSCGKTSFCRLLKELGAYVLSADEIVHQLLSNDALVIQKVVALLGPDILVNKQIDRSRVARKVFQNYKLLNNLEEIVHPAVYEQIEKQYQLQKENSSPPTLFVAEIPLLFETNGEKSYDYTVAIVADIEVCLERFRQQTGRDQQAFNLRASRQWPMMEKATKADYVIMNNTTIHDLRDVTRELYSELTTINMESAL